MTKSEAIAANVAARVKANVLRQAEVLRRGAESAPAPRPTKQESCPVPRPASGSSEDPVPPVRVRRWFSVRGV